MKWMPVCGKDAVVSTMAQLQAAQLPCTIISWSKNKGKGYALKRGFDKARELGFEYVITLDGDGQHYPEDIPLLIDQCRLHPNSIIIGVRQRTKDRLLIGQDGKAAFANRFSNFWFQVQTGLFIQDTQSGYRLYPLRHIAYRYITSRYESELELIVFNAWRNTPIYTTPVRVYYPPKEERVSHFKPVYDFTRISILNTILCIVAIVYGLPSRFWRTPVAELIFFLTALWCRFADGDLHENLGYGAKFVMNHLVGNKFSVNGQPLQTDKPCVYIANHVSLYDILAVLSVNPKIVVVAQGWIYGNPFLGSLAKRARIYSVTDGIESIQPKLEKAVQDGYSILIFPEGTCSLSGDSNLNHINYMTHEQRTDMAMLSAMSGEFSIEGSSDIWKQYWLNNRDRVLTWLHEASIEYGFSQRAFVPFEKLLMSPPYPMPFTNSDIFGQGDDYTIFITEGLISGELYKNDERLVQYKNSVILSALIMFIGVGVLITARHPALHSLAEVTIIGMVCVVLMAYILHHSS